MFVTTKTGRKIDLPSDEEDAEINRQIAADPDEFEWTDEVFKQAKSLETSDLPESFKKTVRQEAARGGRPKSANPKVLLSMRFSPAVVEYFRSTGKGWQTRMDEALKEWIAKHDT